jgi:hypothetical protein
MTQITSEAELRELLGEPLLRTAAKDRPSLHEYDKQWLASSPFTLVLDDTTIAIPERPGNRRDDGFRNMAFLRSDLWQPATWNPEAVPSRAQIVQRFERPGEAQEDLQRYYGPAYTASLYRGRSS